MGCLIAYLLLASVAKMGLAIRGDNEWPGLKKACPEKFSLNTRDECIDTETKQPIEVHCCDDLRWCNERLPQVSRNYMERMMEYFNKCQLQESDARPNSEGKFEIVDNTRLCAEACQNKDELRENNLPSYESLEGKCEHHKELQELKQRDDIVNALHRGFHACTTTTTTTTVTTTTVTTTLDYYDFTYFMNTAMDYSKHYALFPNGAKYYCCCHPNATRNAMSCVLKDTRSETVLEDIRKIVWKSCKAAMGGTYRDWGNVYQNSKKALIRPALQGLQHLAQCVVPNDMLPEAFASMSRAALTKQLLEFRHDAKEYQDGEEEEEEE